jgi:hypothetical protein
MLRVYVSKVRERRYGLPFDAMYISRKCLSQSRIAFILLPIKALNADSFDFQDDGVHQHVTQDNIEKGITCNNTCIWQRTPWLVATYDLPSTISQRKVRLTGTHSANYCTGACIDR